MTNPPTDPLDEYELEDRRHRHLEAAITMILTAFRYNDGRSPIPTPSIGSPPTGEGLPGHIITPLARLIKWLILDHDNDDYTTTQSIIRKHLDKLP